MHFQDEIRGFSDIAMRGEAMEKLREGNSLTVGGIITTVKTHVQRDGRAMAFLTIEDFDGSMELLVFGDAYEKFKHLLSADAMVLVHGQVSVREEDKKPKLRVDNVMALADTRDKLTKSIHVRLKTLGLEEAQMKELLDTCVKLKGSCTLILHIVTGENNEYRIKAKSVLVNSAKESVDMLREKIGRENVWIGKSATA